MSATSAGALKAFLETQGLGLSFYRDGAPEGQAKPYGTVVEAIAITPDQSGDAGTNPTGRELAQVDLWQAWRDPTTKAIVESTTLPGAVFRALHGGRLSTAPTRVYGMVVQSMVRQLERENNVVHTSITVEIRRVI